MEFKERIKKVCRVKNVIIFSLILLFVWCVFNAVRKYWLQPLSTEISYKYGEAKLGVRFPQITLCQPNIFLKDPIIKECHDGTWDFIGAVTSCMKSNNTLKITDLIQNLHPAIGDIVEMVRFWTGSKYISLWPLRGKVWTQVFLEELGPCYIFDLSKANFEFCEGPGVSCSFLLFFSMLDPDLVEVVFC